MRAKQYFKAKSKKTIANRPDGESEDFTVPCKYFPANSYKESPVQCTVLERDTNKCNTCGFNPLVKAARLKKMYGEKKASEAILYSQSISDGVNVEYNKTWGDYSPRKRGNKEEDEDNV